MKFIGGLFSNATISPFFRISSLVLSVSFMLQFSAVHAQNLPSIPTGGINPGTLLSQFMSAIKPSSFTESWTKEKSGWLSAVGKIKDAPGMIGNITSLAKFIKPAMFKNGFSVENLMKTATTAKTMGDAAGLLKGLEGGMKPEAMVSSWAGKKNSWISALDMLK